jgi:glutamate synthase (NADPH/NADH) small chain
VLGPQTAAKAAYQGKEAAESIIRYLEGRDLTEGRIPEPEEEKTKK